MAENKIHVSAGGKALRAKSAKSEKKQVQKRRAIQPQRKPRVQYVEENEACRMLMSLSQKVEKKGSPAAWIHDPDQVNTVRGLLDSKQTYHFRIWAAPVNASVSSNTVQGNFGASPLALPEFSGVLSVLFDEYRVESIKYHIRPIAVGGSTSGFDKYAYAIANDYLAATAPTSWEVCLARAESRLTPVCAQSGSGFFAFETQPQGSGVGAHAWVFKPPRTFALAGSLASVGPYMDIGQAWPGCAQIYSENTASNGTVVLTCWREFHLSFRMRR